MMRPQAVDLGRPRGGGKAMAAIEAEEIVNRFVASWERGDVDEMLAYFADDAVWHPMPVKASVGKPALREAISRWLDSVTLLGAEIHRQVSDGRMVMNERTDRYLLGTREMADTIGSVFEIDNGLITAWREYLDLSAYVQAQKAVLAAGPEAGWEVP
jgi:limonene-1,2-epoxide hydrolase